MTRLHLSLPVVLTYCEFALHLDTGEGFQEFLCLELWMDVKRGVEQFNDNIMELHNEYSLIMRTPLHPHYRPPPPLPLSQL